MQETLVKQQKKKELLETHFEVLQSGGDSLFVDIAVADLKLRWHFVEAKKNDLEFLKKYFRAFQARAEQEVDLHIYYCPLQGEYQSIDHSLWSGDVYSVASPRPLGGRYYLQRDFAAVLNEVGDRVWCLGPQVGEFNTVTLDNLISFSLADHLLKKGRILVHASACVVDGKAWLFMGPSGVGKSTLCNALAAQGLPIISGDRLYLYFTEGRLMASPSPISIAGFERDDTRRTFGSFPVSHIFQLQQRGSYHFKGIPPLDLSLSLLQETLCFQPEYIDHKTHFNLCSQVLQAPDIFWGELSYPKDQPILDYIKKHIAEKTL